MGSSALEAECDSGSHQAGKLARRFAFGTVLNWEGFIKGSALVQGLRQNPLSHRQQLLRSRASVAVVTG